MPAPRTPPFLNLINDLANAVATQTTAIQNLEAQVASQSDDIEKLANFARFQAESFYGPGVDIVGMWDGSDRY